MPRCVVLCVHGFTPKRTRKVKNVFPPKLTKSCRRRHPACRRPRPRPPVGAARPERAVGPLSKTLVAPLRRPSSAGDKAKPSGRPLDPSLGEPATCCRFGGAAPTSWHPLNNVICCTVVLLLLLLISSLMVVGDAVEVLPHFAIAMQSSAGGQAPGNDEGTSAGRMGSRSPSVSSCRMVPTQRRAQQLCSVGPRVRLQQLRHLHWSGRQGAGAPCPDPVGDLSLYNLFQLNVLNEEAILDDHRHSSARRRQLDHLGDGAVDCLLGPARSTGCVQCFEALFRRLRLVDQVFAQFSNAVMASLSCESGTVHRFSAVTTCTDCQVWYKRWLLATFTGIWRLPLCERWCQIVELACPHLSVRRRYDYAGLPSFRCADPSIPAYEQDLSNSEPPKCIHPCDLLPESPGSFSSLFCRSPNTQPQRASSVAASVDEMQAIRASLTGSTAPRVAVSGILIVTLLSIIALHFAAGYNLRYDRPGFG
uniref:FZ domain-containing protein n=1 Tax=Trichuris muris TaxID=70415 RepID=A0A5S6R2F6_TRIMR